VTTSRLEWNLYVATADRGSKRYKAQSFLRFAVASCARRTVSQLAEKSTNREFRCYHPKSCVGRIRVNVARDRASQPTFTKSYAKGIALWERVLAHFESTLHHVERRHPSGRRVIALSDQSLRHPRGGGHGRPHLGSAALIQRPFSVSWLARSQGLC